MSSHGIQILIFGIDIHFCKSVTCLLVLGSFLSAIPILCSAQAITVIWQNQLLLYGRINYCYMAEFRYPDKSSSNENV